MAALNDSITEAELYAYVRGVIDRTHAWLPSRAVAVRRPTLGSTGTVRVMLDRRATADRRKT